MTQMDIAAPKPPVVNPFTWGTGRRKSAVARVRIRPGEGKFLINERALEEYFPREGDRQAINSPLAAANGAGKWDIFVNVQGGGLTGQTGAVLLGLARALVKAEPACEAALRDQGLLTRDARKVERKKYGRSGARRGFQFSKR
jgi:small subunit ribosomal protein S9